MHKPTVAAIVAFSLAVSAYAAETFTGYTSPSDEAKLAFPQIGSVGKITVEEGDRVKANEEVIRQDTDQEQARLEAYEMDADKTLDKDAAIKEKEQAGSDLKRIKEMRTTNVASEYEEEQAALKYDLAGINVNQVDQQAAIATAQAKIQKERIKDMIMLSPIEGIVAAIDTNVGNVVDQDDVVIHIVKLDPLEIEVPGVTSAAAAALRNGQSVDVLFPGEKDWKQAEIKFISPLVIRASDTRAIKLTLPNAEGRPAGLRVQVRLPDSVAKSQ